MTLQEIINETNADAALTALHDAIKTNKWDSPIVKPFGAVKKRTYVYHTQCYTSRNTDCHSRGSTTTCNRYST
jgi:hypothetical protein